MQSCICKLFVETYDYLLIQGCLPELQPKLSTTDCQPAHIVGQLINWKGIIQCLGTAFTIVTSDAD